MLCQTCKRRPGCGAACAALSAELRSLEVCQRELPLDPWVIEQISDRTRAESSEESERGGTSRNRYRVVFPALPARLLEVLLLRYSQGLGPREIARRQGVHYRTALARLREAEALMRRSVSGAFPSPVVRPAPRGPGGPKKALDKGAGA